MMQRRPAIVAHRGASHSAPENSAEAINTAKRLGADWVEVDVRITADHQAVLAHDAVIGGLHVESSTRSELMEVTNLCSLDEGLDAAGTLGVNLEIKGPIPSENAIRAAELVATLLRAGKTRCMISSFWPVILDAFKSVLPDVPTGLLTASSYDVDGVASIEGALYGRHSYAVPEYPSVHAELIEEAHRSGLLVWTWTVDDEHRLGELWGWGIDGIITNDLAAASRVLGRS